MHGAITASSGCLLSGPNNTTWVDYRRTETVPLGPPTFIIFSAVCSILSLSENEATETELITPGSDDVLLGCWIVLIFPYATADTRVFKYQQLFQCINAMPAALRTFTGNRIRTCPRDAIQATVKKRSKVSHLLNPSSLKHCPYPQNGCFPRDSSNSDPTRPQKVWIPTLKTPVCPQHLLTPARDVSAALLGVCNMDRTSWPCSSFWQYRSNSAQQLAL